MLVGSRILYVGLSLLYPSGSFSKALWSILMLSVDSAISFCGVGAISTVLLPNVFPETAQHTGSVRLLSFARAKSRWSKSSHLNWINNKPRARTDPALVITVLTPFWAAPTILEKIFIFNPGTRTIGNFTVQQTSCVSRAKNSRIPYAVPNMVLSAAALISIGGFILV